MADQQLPETAIPVWNAYEGMASSKRQHFEYLNYLERKYEQYGQPDESESGKLQNLLEQHDVQVKMFKSLLNQLRVSEPLAYAAIVKKLSEQA